MSDDLASNLAVMKILKKKKKQAKSSVHTREINAHKTPFDDLRVSTH